MHNTIALVIYYPQTLEDIRAFRIETLRQSVISTSFSMNTIYDIEHSGNAVKAVKTACSNHKQLPLSHTIVIVMKRKCARQQRPY